VLKWLDDTEVTLTHRRVNKVTLSHVYVPLDMEQLRQSRNEDLIIKCTEKMFAESGQYILSGEEQQGKTTVLKQAFRHLAQIGSPVLYLDAASINSADLSKVLTKAVGEQFNGIDLESFSKDATPVILLDNLHEIKLNERYRNSFLEALVSYSKHVIITCSTAFTYVIPDIGPLDDYQRYELLGLGHKRRAELVEKWVALGVEECISETELFNQCDEIKDQLNAVIRKNIVPSKPFYILMLLQMLEAGSQQNLDLSSHGHCYQQLIYQSFDKAKIGKKEFDTYLNVLTELAWELHRNNTGINQAQLDEFFEKYAEVYLSVDGSLMIQKLKENSILSEKDHKLQFKYPYIYYFFVAKKIAEFYTSELDIREAVKNLIENLHREDYANILVFVTHHTKEKWVLDEIDAALKSLFADHTPALLSGEQLNFMQEFIAQIPDLVIEQRVIREERAKNDLSLDELERNDDSLLKLSEASKNALNIDVPAVINRTFKGMEISGQIIRNRYATLPKASLLALAEQGANCGLRFLTFFIEISDAVKKDVIKFVASSLEANPDSKNTKIEADATKHFLMMTYGVINGVLRKTATSIGSKEANLIYELLPGLEKSPALLLLNQSISLRFTRKIDFTKRSQTHEKLKNNPVCMRILKDMVVQHSYMFPLNFKEKQQLSALLSIPVNQQRLMDRKKSIKA